MTRKTILTLCAAAACAGGCRADGGFDRKDSDRGLAFSTKCVSDRTREDAATTMRSISSAPHEFVRSFATSKHDLNETWKLYFESQSAK